MSDVGEVGPDPVLVIGGQAVIPPPLDVPTCKVGKLRNVLVSCVPLFHFLRHEKSLSNGVGDESVGLLSSLGDQAPQNCTGI